MYRIITASNVRTLPAVGSNLRCYNVKTQCFVLAADLHLFNFIYFSVVCHCLHSRCQHTFIASCNKQSHACFPHLYYTHGYRLHFTARCYWGLRVSHLVYEHERVCMCVCILKLYIPRQSGCHHLSLLCPVFSLCNSDKCQTAGRG